MTGAKRPGFSLMEMLIVITLFSLMMLVVTQTFSSFNLLHRKIANKAVVSQELRFAMELLVRVTRNHEISYSPPPASRASELHLLQPNGPEMAIKRSSVGDPVCGDLPTVACLVLSTDGGLTWVPITGKKIHVEQFDVYVRPSASPFELSGATTYPNNTQPFVTLHLRMRYMAERVQEQQVLETQTSVSSRVYKR